METSGDNVPEPIESFEVDMLGEDLMRTTTLCGYSKPTPVQKYSIPIGISNRDLMACAQTGSGKTAGFLFPTLISLLRRGGPQVCGEEGGGDLGRDAGCRRWVGGWGRGGGAHVCGCVCWSVHVGVGVLFVGVGVCILLLAPNFATPVLALVARTACVFLPMLLFIV